MKALTEKLVHYLVLIAVTIFAIGVMWKLSAKQQLQGKQAEVQVRPLALVSVPKAPVAVAAVHLQMCEITSTYAGKIQPWETYQIGFPGAGRVISLGTNADGQPLDDGDRVQAGQILATMDDRVLRARKSEAAARIEQVTSDFQRAQRARQTNRSAVTDSELQQWVTDLALARAQQEIATKNLDDATLRAPVNATIARRLINSGESVSPNQVVFELVENDDVLLVVDVPETQIRELERRMREVQQNQPATLDSRLSASRPPDAAQEEASAADSDTSAAIFRAHVQLEGRDRFGRLWPRLDGEVYRIPEVSDPRTGLFAVEIRLANSDRLLRPGMVATADVVTDQIPGYRIPEAAVLFRQGNAFLFTINSEQSPMELLYWKLGPTQVYRAYRIELNQWIDQGDHVIVPQEETQLRSVITRGQFRLADKQVVRVMNLDELSPGITTQALNKQNP